MLFNCDTPAFYLSHCTVFIDNYKNHIDLVITLGSKQKQILVLFKITRKMFDKLFIRN